MLYKISLKGIFYFWIECEIDENQLYSFIKSFDYQRGIYGFKRINTREKKKVMLDFLEYIKDFNPRVIYKNSLDIELQKRYISPHTFLRMLKDNNIVISKNTLNRWLNNSITPSPDMKKKIEDLLSFTWV